MNTSIASVNSPVVEPLSRTPAMIVQTITAEPLSPSADVFARHCKVPGHNQEALARARIGLVGCGGLNSWAGVALARTGAMSLVFMDDDFVDPPNLSRQFFFAQDLAQSKALRLAANLRSHLIAGGQITGIALPFEKAVEEFALSVDLLVVGVDNNACRLACVRWCRQRRIPAVFAMLSTDGTRCQIFSQGPVPGDACLWCALPNLDPEEAAPCEAGAILSSCFLANAFTVFFVHRALMGWPAHVQPFNWREADLLDMVPHRSGMIGRRPQCNVCNNL